MIVVKVWAGLANKMFQYALYKSLMDRRKDVSIDDFTFSPNWEFEDVSLKDVFPHVDYVVADKELVKRLNTTKNGIYSRIKNKIFKYFSIIDIELSNHVVEPKYSFNQFLFELEGDYYLEGFWQSAKYFQDISSTIRNDFAFTEFEEANNIYVQQQMRKSESVGIHVRKGKDYKKSITAGTCDLKYYKESIMYLNNKLNNPEYFVFSDNIEWCRENLNFCNPVYIDWNPTEGLKNYLDMQLMANCKHNIIANSSYSWWGAWLNKNPKKIVVAPKTWFNPKYSSLDTSDIVPDNWIKI